MFCEFCNFCAVARAYLVIIGLVELYVFLLEPYHVAAHV